MGPRHARLEHLQALLAPRTDPYPRPLVRGPGEQHPSALLSVHRAGRSLWAVLLERRLRERSDPFPGSRLGRVEERPLVPGPREGWDGDRGDLTRPRPGP